MSTAESTPKERVQLEYQELAEKRLALSKLLNGAQPKFMGDLQWSLLQVQKEAMDSYSKILVVRLEYWED